MPRFTDEQAVGYTRKIRGAGGPVTWDGPMELNSAIPQSFVGQLAGLRKASGNPPR